MSNEKLTELLKKQEEERLSLAAGVYVAWQPVKERDEQLLKAYSGKYENAPDVIKQDINQRRQEFYAEYGTQGKLAVIMEARHTAEREKLAQQQETAQEIRNSLREKGNSQGRGR
ncbi:hypothetical protein Q4E93_10005 [Flavitalea sp. BT771]|uniref:hypothetical protein n=1 Tax=Flavitalea sp. BT771 TaxID=3063329 RepID=UPI0026E40847|nr:hypothetical protein [Flavitalea sp. BT771]MDO6430921.1 hypothetical protein [Flavitalea sp. BT771]MDV6218939.1 hypothetical protein [Flavitalea sp. BT771]